MRIAAVSDLHIGAHGYTDAFGHDTERFGRFLDRLEHEHDRVVLLGDVFATDHTAWPSAGAHRRALMQACRRVPALVERFERPAFVHVAGNHDAVAESARGAQPHVRFAGRFPALFIHGHQFDPVAVRASWAADLGTWSMGRLRAAGLRALAWQLELRDVAIKDQRFRGPDGPYARGASGLAREHDVAFVVMGHTHVPCICPAEGVVMVNTGTCSGGRTMWVSLDTEAGTVQVHEPGARRSYRASPSVS